MTHASDCSINGEVARHLICSFRLFIDDVSTSAGLATLIIPTRCVLGRELIRQFHGNVRSA